MNDEDFVRLLLWVVLKEGRFNNDKPLSRLGLMEAINDFYDKIMEDHDSDFDVPVARLNNKCWYAFFPPGKADLSDEHFNLCVKFLTHSKSQGFLLPKEDLFCAEKRSKIVSALNIAFYGSPLKTDITFENFITAIRDDGESYLAYHEALGLIYKLILTDVVHDCICSASLLVYKKHSFAREQDLNVPTSVYRGTAEISPPGDFEIRVKNNRGNFRKLFSVGRGNLDSTGQITSFKMHMQGMKHDQAEELEDSDFVQKFLRHCLKFEKRSVSLPKIMAKLSDEE